MEVKKWHCLRCGKSWWPKIPPDGKIKKPKVCALCKSPYWDKPIVRFTVSKKGRVK
jgi:NAD-dependent SIR2 family protein deacetylase